MATETASRIQQWHELAQQLRVDSIRATTQAGSGHPTSSMSAADLAAVLLAGHLRYDFSHPENPNNDHLILSKGHAAPLLYAMYKAAGAVTDEGTIGPRSGPGTCAAVATGHAVAPPPSSVSSLASLVK